MENNNGLQHVQNNRLSYVGASYQSPHTGPNINLSIPSNDIATYGTLNNTNGINGVPSRSILNQHGTLGIESVRPTALVSSYISSLNNAAVSQNVLLLPRSSCVNNTIYK